MPTIRIDLDMETYGKLMEQAGLERRPLPLQAEVTLRRALGLPFPYPRQNGEGVFPENNRSALDTKD